MPMDTSGVGRTALVRLGADRLMRTMAGFYLLRMRRCLLWATILMSMARLIVVIVAIRLALQGLRFLLVALGLRSFGSLVAEII